MIMNVKYNLLMLLVFTGLLLGCSSDDESAPAPVPQEPEAGTLSGRVTNVLEDATEMGLEGAEVSVLAADTLNTAVFTDVNGDYSVTGLMAGSSYEVNVTLDGYEPAVAENVIIVAGEQTTLDFNLIATEEPAFATRINSGGPAFSFDGLDWVEDEFFDGGTTFSSTIDIASTTNMELYQTERFAGTLVYEIPVAAGNYDVNLHFAEIYYGVPGAGEAGGEGSRVFNVDIENGQEQLTDYDIIVAAGGAATAVVEVFSGITVDDGFLTVTFTSVVDNAKISGIEVLEP